MEKTFLYSVVAFLGAFSFITTFTMEKYKKDYTSALHHLLCVLFFICGMSTIVWTIRDLLSDSITILGTLCSLVYIIIMIWFLRPNSKGETYLAIISNAWALMLLTMIGSIPIPIGSWFILPVVIVGAIVSLFTFEKPRAIPQYTQPI